LCAKYILPGGHAPDGILYNVLYGQKEAFDSKKIKEKVMLDPSTGVIMGFHKMLLNWTLY
jgi:hypothetical protein